MGKLNPPVIEGTIPAFYGKDIIVPFKMNRSVGDKEFSGLRLKIKTIYNNSENI